MYVMYAMYVMYVAHAGVQCTCCFLFIVNMTQLQEPEKERGIKFTAESC